MCEACEKFINRRTVLRGAILGGAAAATTSLWRPDSAWAGGDTFEYKAMAEDAWKAVSPAAATTAASHSTAQAAPSAAASTSSGSATAASSASGTAIAATRSIPSPNVNALKAPPVVTRSQWGADESIRFDNRAYAPVRKLIVHHTASANNPRNPAEVVRFVQRYHTIGRGFVDTGYNYFIDHKGVIYEGRAARKYGDGEIITDEDNNGWGVVGAHAKGNNAGSCGICLIGDFDLGAPTDAAVASLVWLLAYKASRHRIDPVAADDYIDIYGNRRSYPNISGHRQVGATACPGSRLFKLLPTIRDEVARRAGHWNPLVVDVPGVLRWEGGPLRAPKAITSNAGGGAGGSTVVDPGTGTKLVGFRVVSEPGRVYTAGEGRDHGSPSSLGATNVVALANTIIGDGYWALAQNGAVYGLGVETFGDPAGKGVAADLAITGTGRGYWVLMADGGIHPFGDAGYASSPRKAGIGGVSRRIVARPQADGYWVLVDNVVRAFGNAPKLGSPTQSGSLVDFCATPSGKGYWALTDAGVVVPYGDAPDKGDVARAGVKWSRKRPTHIVATPSGGGYVVVNAEGSMLAFGDAPLFASFGGSGMKATGVAPAFG